MTPDQYQRLYDTMIVTPGRQGEVVNIVKRITAGKSRYDVPAQRTGVPWFFIGIVHYRECNLSFNHHLHNGDPLSAKTVNVPAGRPLVGNPPYDWATSAIDALQQRGLDKFHDWDVPSMLYRLEGYNGYGYQSRGVNSPYLWGATNHYEKGLFVKDHVFDAEAKSQQIGSAPLLKLLIK